MMTNNMINEEIELSKEELSNVSGGHGVTCIGCGERISSPNSLVFAAKVKIHNATCAWYKAAVKMNRTYWGATNLYASLMSR